MPDNYFEDVPQPVHRKSIRQIPIPASRRRRRAGEPVPPAPRQPLPEVDDEAVYEAPRPEITSEREQVPVRRINPQPERMRQPQAEDDYYPDTQTPTHETMDERPRRAPIRDGHFESSGRNRGGKALMIGVLLVVIGCVWAIGAIFSGARLDVQAKQLSVDLSAVGDLVLTENTDYRTVSFTMSATESVAATEEKDVERKASGVITIFNDFDNQPQDLVATTRFRTPAGVIFRIAEDITVPGNTTSGAATVPGSIQATVYADEAGQEGNIGPSDFVIPGFEGTPKYNAFSAKSTSPMTGGFVGTVKTVSDDEIAKVESRLKDTIRTQVTDKAKSEVGEEGYVLPVEPEISFAEPVVQEANNQATITVTATVVVLVMDEARLGAVLAKNEASEGTIKVSNKDALSLSIKENDANQRTLSGSGTAELVWTIDRAAVQTAAAGKKKADAVTSVASVAGVESVTAKLSPFWKRSFPENSGDIEVVIK